MVDLIEEKGYCLGNLDAIVIAQKPKLSPYIDEMRQKIAETCHAELSQISVKATTEEHLGFTGREEGISAHCGALLYEK